MKLINVYEVNRAFFKAKQRMTSDEFYQEPAPAFYTTKDIGDFVLEKLEEVRQDIVGCQQIKNDEKGEKII